MPHQLSLGTHFQRYWDGTLVGEVLVLAVTMPVLYFPHRFPTWALYAGLGLLPVGWLWRRWRLGYWGQRTPADWPLLFLFFVMLPVSVWAAPGPLREEHALPRALILIWNFFLFYTVASHASRSRRLSSLMLGGFLGIGVLLALVVPFGMNWRYRFPGARMVLSRVPTPLAGIFQGAEAGFDSNQLAGTLLYVLPLLIALTIALWLRRQWRSPLFWLLGGCTAWMGALLLATQSRGGLLGFLVGMVVMALIPQRWGRWALLVGSVGLVFALPLLPLNPILESLNDADVVATVGGTATLTGFRVQVWTQAVTALHDFAFTGMGLGTFREIVFLLYPLAGIPPTYDIAHAHNFWLQSGLDFGVPGLVALLALYLLAAYALVRLWGRTMPALVIGLIGCLTAQSVYSLLDSVSMGSKPNFFFWYLFALIFALAHRTVQPTSPALPDLTQDAVAVPTGRSAGRAGSATSRQTRRGSSS